MPVMKTPFLAFIAHDEPFVSRWKVRARKVHVVECQEFVRQEWNYQYQLETALNWIIGIFLACTALDRLSLSFV